MNYKDLDKDTQELVKFADFLTRLIVVVKGNYLDLMHAFPDTPIKKNCFVFSYDKDGYNLTYYKPSGALGYQPPSPSPPANCNPNVLPFIRGMLFTVNLAVF